MLIYGIAVCKIWFMTSPLETGRTEAASEYDSHQGGFGTPQGVNLHPLSAEQIAQLTNQGCSCEDWSGVQVADGFDAGRVR